MYQIYQKNEEDYSLLQIDEHPSSYSMKESMYSENMLALSNLHVDNSKFKLINDLMKKVEMLAEELHQNNVMTQRLIEENQILTQSEQRLKIQLQSASNSLINQPNQFDQLKFDLMKEENASIIYENKNLNRLLEQKNQELQLLNKKLISIEQQQKSQNNYFTIQQNHGVLSEISSNNLQQQQQSQNYILNKNMTPSQSITRFNSFNIPNITSDQKEYFSMKKDSCLIENNEDWKSSFNHLIQKPKNKIDPQQAAKYARSSALTKKNKSISIQNKVQKKK